MIYLIGDTHSRFDQIKYICTTTDRTENDVLLGDTGVNVFFYPRHYLSIHRNIQLKNVDYPLYPLKTQHNHKEFG